MAALLRRDEVSRGEGVAADAGLEELREDLFVGGDGGQLHASPIEGGVGWLFFFFFKKMREQRQARERRSQGETICEWEK